MVLILTSSHKQENMGATAPYLNQPVSASVLHLLTTIPASTYAEYATSKTVSFVDSLGANIIPDTASQAEAAASSAAKASGTSSTPSTPLAEWTSGGKPVIFYAGAEYCPYCAASRWGLITALARFGTFSGLEYMASSPIDVYPLTPTFTFVHATYTSNYIDFIPVELYSYVYSSKIGYYETLETPNSTEETALTRLGNGGIPFVDLANEYVWPGGTLVSPTIFPSGAKWSEVAQEVHAGQGQIGEDVLGVADVITANICKMDGGQPSDVCSTVRSLEGVA